MLCVDGRIIVSRRLASDRPEFRAQCDSRPDGSFAFWRELYRYLCDLRLSPAILTIYIFRRWWLHSSYSAVHHDELYSL
jgi:hypothetical protein